MSDKGYSRRDVLRGAGAALTATTAGAGLISAQEAAHAHHAVAQAKAAGAYKPAALTDHEYATLRRLCELIIPADEHSKGALEAGAPEFIDFLSSRNDELKEIFTGGLAWLDNQAQKRYAAQFVEARPADQTAMLDLIAYRKNDSPELGPGIRFFDWARRMTVDAFYTSKIGMDDLGYMGNTAVAKFEVPAEAVQYALKRSHLG